MIGRRINFQGHNGTIHYEGPIVHEDRGQDIWVGIEWDDITRGRHNGTVSGHVYFTTWDNQPSGSLLKRDKIPPGVNILDAIFLKYFKEIP
jgi:dynactin complex subunit